MRCENLFHCLPFNFFFFFRAIIAELIPRWITDLFHCSVATLYSSAVIFFLNVSVSTSLLFILYKTTSFTASRWQVNGKVSLRSWATTRPQRSLSAPRCGFSKSLENYWRDGTLFFQKIFPHLVFFKVALESSAAPKSSIVLSVGSWDTSCPLVSLEETTPVRTEMFHHSVKVFFQNNSLFVFSEPSL